MTSYEIRVKGHLDRRRSECFNGLTNANLQDGVAVLNKVRNLNLPLISVTNLEPRDRRARLLDARPTGADPLRSRPGPGERHHRQRHAEHPPAKHRSDRPREHYMKEEMMTTQNQSGGPSQHRLARQVGGRKWLS